MRRIKVALVRSADTAGRHSGGMEESPTEQLRASTGVTVVLVEDHVMLADLLTTLLTEAGIRVLAAAGTQRDGRRAVTAHRPRVAIIDNELPDGSGVDLCRMLKAQTPDVTLLLHTGVTSTFDTAEALEA